MSELQEHIEGAIKGQRLLLPGESFLVAVSGGLDSMVLLHLLWQMAQPYRWRLVLAHFNHQLRGTQSDADAAFVRQTARTLEIPCRAGRADARAFAARRRFSIEMAARQLRHQFFARTAVALGVKKVVLAHHADDQLELFFLRLLRGAGPEGLIGMKLISDSPWDSRVQLVRPLLTVTRARLAAFAAEHSIPFRHDPSNAKLDCERNRIRHELLPFLRDRFQPALDSTVSRLLEILGAESDLVAQATRQAHQQKNAVFEALHPAVQRRWLRDGCLGFGIAPEFDLIERLRLTPDRKVMVNPDLIIWRDIAGQLLSCNPTPSVDPRGERIVRLSGRKGDVSFANVRLVWSIKRWHGSPSRLAQPSPGQETFDAVKVGCTIRLRRWRPGDRFQPIGMPMPVKVQDLLTNGKIPRSHRRELAIAETLRGEILWIEGLRISERFKVDAGTTRCLVWRWEHTATDAQRETRFQD